MALRERPGRGGGGRTSSAAARLLALVTLLALACGDADPGDSTLVAGGSPERGRAAIREYGCGACHTIAEVRGARGNVGPPLDGIARRVYVGGVLLNTPENLVRWIRDPQAVDSLTAMPDLGVSEREATDIASFLYTLR